MAALFTCMSVSLPVSLYHATLTQWCESHGSRCWWTGGAGQMKQPWQKWAPASSCQSVKWLAEGILSLFSLSMLLITTLLTQHSLPVPAVPAVLLDPAFSRFLMQLQHLAWQTALALD